MFMLVLRKVITELSEFLEHPLSEEKIDALVHHVRYQLIHSILMQRNKGEIHQVTWRFVWMKGTRIITWSRAYEGTSP